LRAQHRSSVGRHRSSNSIIPTDRTFSLLPAAASASQPESRCKRGERGEESFPIPYGEGGPCERRFFACHTPGNPDCHHQPPPSFSLPARLPRRRRGYLGVAWQRHGGRATTKERSIDLSRRMAGVRTYPRTSVARNGVGRSCGENRRRVIRSSVD